MSQLWTIVSRSSPTTVIEPLWITDSSGQHPKDKGLAWNADTMLAKRIDARPDLVLQVWTGSAWVDDAVDVQVQLLGRVKAEAERRRMLVRTPGSGKQDEYAEKKVEAVASVSVTAAILNALSSQAALTQYPNAALEAQLTGEPIATVLSRYLAGWRASVAERRRLSAIEQAGCRSIKAAATAAAKRAAYAAINWSWQPS